MSSEVVRAVRAYRTVESERLSARGAGGQDPLTAWLSVVKEASQAALIEANKAEPAKSAN